MRKRTSQPHDAAEPWLGLADHQPQIPDTSYLVAVLQQRSHYQSVGLIDLGGDTQVYHFSLISRRLLHDIAL